MPFLGICRRFLVKAAKKNKALTPHQIVFLNAIPMIHRRRTTNYIPLMNSIQIPFLDKFPCSFFSIDSISVKFIKHTYLYVLTHRIHNNNLQIRQH